MNRHARFFALCATLATFTAQAQLPEQVDSMLAAHQYSNALRLIDSDVTPPAQSPMTDARALIGHVQHLTNIPDSTLNARMLQASGLPMEYDVDNAGARAASSYADFLASYASKDVHSAYEHFLLAKYFRVQHLKRERARLRNNIAMAAYHVQNEDFEAAEGFLDMFNKEKRTSAFVTLEDTLRRAYNWLQPQIEYGKAKHDVALSRTPISKTLYIVAGGGLNPRVQLDKNQLLLREFATEEYTVWDLSDNSVRTVSPLLCLEAGYYFSSRTSIGFSYARGAITVRNAMLVSRTSVSYRAKIEYARADILLTYRLTDRTGPRPYLIGGAGLTTSTLSPMEDSGAEHILYVKPVSDNGWHAVLGVGAEFIFSENLPFVASWGGMMFFNSGPSEILKPYNFEVTLQLGVVI